MWRALIFLCVTALLAGTLLLAPSCGAMVGVALVTGDTMYPDWDLGLSLRDGTWRGDYVWYDGAWYYEGWGTPYSYPWHW
jgi:hypothetical protein